MLREVPGRQVNRTNLFAPLSDWAHTHEWDVISRLQVRVQNIHCMLVERKRSKTFLGDFELTVLLAVLRLGPEAYGTAIIGEIERRTGRSVPGGALYVTLDRMEAKGLIRSRLGDGDTSRGGRPRRYVNLTNKGFEAVRESRAALLNLMSGLESMFRGR